MISFLLAALVSLTASWLLVTRLERLGERFGLTEGLLGMLAALAANAPEVTSAVTALIGHQRQVGAGVVLGSNVFNLAALLGLGALVAGRVAFHRRVLVLTGAVGIWLAVVCLLTVLGLLPPAAGLVVACLAFGPYVVALGRGGRRIRRLRLPVRLARWLGTAVTEEELELAPVVHARPGRPADGVLAGAALVVVVLASVVMEHAAVGLGRRHGVPGIVTGALVLAAVTSLPNAVAAVYLSLRGRGAAVLSTAFNSNALNVVVGYLLPAAVLGLGSGPGPVVLVAAWYAGLTVATAAAADAGRGLGRVQGALIIVAYGGFAAAVVAAG